jgi:hypothetical protein
VSDPAVLFCVPVIARALAGDWSVVEANLARTLASLLRQGDGRWRAVVCGQDMPELPDDPRIEGLTIDRPLDGDDKWAKITAIIARVPETAALLFPLDADDLLHPDLVALMATETADGWLLVDGYSVDTRSGALGRHGAPDEAHPKRAPFYRVCGSSGAVRMVPDNIKATRQMLVRHFEFPQTAAAHGQMLRPVPFPGAAYLVAHGENQESRSGREADKLAYIRANPVPEDEAREARRVFGLADAAPGASAPP